MGPGFPATGSVRPVMTLQRWRSLSADAAGRYAAAIADAVGANAFEVGLPDSWYRPILVARFQLDGRAFVLVPGGVARLGYDGRRFEPSQEELASFLGDYDAHLSDRDLDGADESVEDHESPQVPVLPGQLELFPAGPMREVIPRQAPAGDIARLRAYLASRLTPPRTTTMPTLLVAADSVVAGLTEVTADHPVITQHLHSRRPWSRGACGCDGDFGVPDDDQGTYARIEFDPYTGQVRRC